MNKFSANAHWRDASRSPKFFFLDAYAAFPLLFWLMHITWWTFLTAIAAITFFAILERFKFTIPVFIRWFKSFLAGPYRSAHPWWRE
ncbi:MAG: phosphoesterase [Legionellales bacterium]|nr:MAG: phosphoesterase [Legionellales bacterium]